MVPTPTPHDETHCPSTVESLEVVKSVGSTSANCNSILQYTFLEIISTTYREINVVFENKAQFPKNFNLYLQTNKIWKVFLYTIRHSNSNILQTSILNWKVPILYQRMIVERSMQFVKVCE